jgi:hypothetical protein
MTEVIHRIKHAVLEDLRLWVDFLEQDNRGISLNILTIREPTLSTAPTRASTESGDSMCFTVEPGFSRSLPTYRTSTLNVLEFFVSIVGP